MYSKDVWRSQPRYLIGLYEVISFLQVLQFQHKSTKSVDHENEVKIILQMSGWHVPCMIIVWIKYGESRVYGNGKTIFVSPETKVTEGET
jgi:hypothetical protein